jgi:tuftelin-interacting protein 11
MARRKKAGMLSDGSDSESGSASDYEYNSQEDEDSRAERRLFERKHKRPRVGGKEAAWEGIFGAGDEPPPPRGGASGRGRGGAHKTRTDWTKWVPSESGVLISRTPSFVSSKAKAGTDADSDNDTGADSTRPASPRVIEEEEDEPRRGMGMGGMGGMSGMNAMRAFMSGGAEAEPSAESPSSAGLGAAPKRTGRMGLGAVKSMFTAGRPAEDDDKEPQPDSKAGSDDDEDDTAKSVPSAFGKSASAFSAFKANASRDNFTSKSASPAPSTPTPPTHTLTGSEKAHFSKIAGSFGARMLAKQGWTPGKGLGVDESGLAVPIAVKVMQRGAGIQSGIRSEESKREAIRKGELEEEEEPRSRGGRGKKKGGSSQAQGPPRDGWKREKRVKVRVEHKTYDELIAEEDTTRAGVGLVLDARGGDLKAVESLSKLSLSTWTPTADTMQLPELRHNLRLILDVSRGEVTNLAKEGKAVNEKRRWSTREEERARVKLDAAAGDIKRIEAIQAAVEDVAAAAEAEARKGGTSLAGLDAPFEVLLSNKAEYVELSLDDVVVAAIDQVLGRTLAAWDPFDISSDALLAALKPWRRAFNLDSASTGTMTAWESLLWNRWLPKVRSAMNNEWTATDPLLAVHLFEAWEPLLPAFIRDNFLDQLVLPKIMDAIDRWRPKDGISLATIIFPWLPLLGERLSQVLDEGKRRVKAVLRSWNVSDGPVPDLARWKADVFSSSEWDKLMGEFVLPRLGAVLRDELTINPRAQDMQPLNWVLPWAPLLRPSHFVRLFELEFFPKWLNVLYLWLVHPGFNGDEVAQWFEMWKNTFPQDVRANPAIAHGFSAGLRLMDQALELGDEAPTRLQKPVFTPLPAKSKSSKAQGSSSSSRTPQAPSRPAPAADITFRSIVEDFIAAKDLIMVPLGRSHPTTGKPLFRVGQSTDKGGFVVYIGEDAVFVQEEGSFRAMTLDELVKSVR